MQNPENYFSDLNSRTLYKDHPRAGFQTAEDLDKINLDEAYRFYNQVFADANDFTFMFVGNFDEKEVLPMLAKYLGNLPASGGKKAFKDIGMNYQTGQNKKVVKKGSEPKSINILSFTGPFAWSDKNRYELDIATKVLSIMLRESMREDQGGVYGVRVYSYPSRYPEPDYITRVQFTCAPENAEKLTETVLEKMAYLRKKGPSETNLNKVKESMYSNFETEQKDNRYWLNYLNSTATSDNDLMRINRYEEMIKGISAKDIKKAAKKYFAAENYLQMRLLPEEEAAK